MQRKIGVFILVIALIALSSCQKPSEPIRDNTQQDVPEDSQDNSDNWRQGMDNYKYAETVVATKEDVLKALQGSWSSKENGFNFKIVISDNLMKIGYSDHEMTEMEFDILPGMPIQIVPKIDVFDRSKGRGYSSYYEITSMYYVNDRITLTVKEADSDEPLEDEVVLSRGLTKEELDQVEGITPKPNLVYNADNKDDDLKIYKSIQGTWEGRDNCNYSVIVSDQKVAIRTGTMNVLETTIHLSKNNPAHLELEDNMLDSGNIKSDVFGLYYLDSSQILLSIHSDFMNYKFEYILRRPSHFGRFILDEEILPELQGVWVETSSQEELIIKDNTVQFQHQKDTFHVRSYSKYELKRNIFHLVGVNARGDSIMEYYTSIQYSDGELMMYMPVYDAESPKFVFRKK